MGSKALTSRFLSLLVDGCTLNSHPGHCTVYCFCPYYTTPQSISSFILCINDHFAGIRSVAYVVSQERKTPRLLFSFFLFIPAQLLLCALEVCTGFCDDAPFDTPGSRTTRQLATSPSRTPLSSQLSPLSYTWHQDRFILVIYPILRTFNKLGGGCNVAS
ncbi:hypothetical protein BCR39DRAFT_526415, partial [Naematelia encephala]